MLEFGLQIPNDTHPDVVGQKEQEDEQEDGQEDEQVEEGEEEKPEEKGAHAPSVAAAGLLCARLTCCSLHCCSPWEMKRMQLFFGLSARNRVRYMSVFVFVSHATL